MQSIGISMETALILTRLWDYGWLCRASVKLAGASSDAALIEQYVASPVFHTSFLPNDKDETGIHGPFVAERITAVDFVPIGETKLGQYLESVQLSDTPGEDVAERAKMLPHLRAPFEEGRRGYVLRRDERDRDLFHEWGSVLFVFREFLFVGPEQDCLERFVIGYD
jgi:hypothetical protein